MSRLLLQMREKARREFGIGHITLQLERTASDCAAEDHHVGHLPAHARRS